MGLYSFLRGKIPLDQNNLRQGFVQPPLPFYSTIAWPQFRVLKPFRETPDSGQLWVAQSVPVAGLGGLVAGGIVFQPLAANPNPNQ